MFHRQPGFTDRKATSHQGSARLDNSRRVWCTLEGNGEMGPKALLAGELLPLGTGKSAPFELVDIYTGIVVREGESATPPRCMKDGIVFGTSYYRAWDDTFVPFSMPIPSRAQDALERRCVESFSGDLRLAHLEQASGKGCEGVWSRDRLGARDFMLLGSQGMQEWQTQSPTAQFLGVTPNVGVIVMNSQPVRWVDMTKQQSFALGARQRFARPTDLLLDESTGNGEALWYLDYRSMSATPLVKPGECVGNLSSEGEGRLVVVSCAPTDGSRPWHAAFHLGHRDRYALDASTWGTVRPVGEGRLVGVRKSKWPHVRLVLYELSNNVDRPGP